MAQAVEATGGEEISSKVHSKPRHRELEEPNRTQEAGRYVAIERQDRPACRSSFP
jgi:hypothetical protein